MKNQFFYTRLEKITKPLVNGEEQPEEFQKFDDSFNTNYVIRSISQPNGGRLILLDDFHEEVVDAPIFNKAKKRVGVKKEKRTYCSEIVLLPEDAERFVKHND